MVLLQVLFEIVFFFLLFVYSFSWKNPGRIISLNTVNQTDVFTYAVTCSVFELSKNPVEVLESRTVIWTEDIFHYFDMFATISLIDTEKGLVYFTTTVKNSDTTPKHRQSLHTWKYKEPKFGEHGDKYIYPVHHSEVLIAEGYDSRRILALFQNKKTGNIIAIFHYSDKDIFEGFQTVYLNPETGQRKNITTTNTFCHDVSFSYSETTNTLMYGIGNCLNFINLENLHNFSTCYDGDSNVEMGSAICPPINKEGSTGSTCIQQASILIGPPPPSPLTFKVEIFDNETASITKIGNDYDKPFEMAQAFGFLNEDLVFWDNDGEDELYDIFAFKFSPPQNQVYDTKFDEKITPFPYGPYGYDPMV